MEITEQPFPFLCLPASLRIHIYAHLLVNTHGYILHIANLPPTWPQKVSKALHPTILHVCKLVHGEAAPALWSEYVHDPHLSFQELSSGANCVY
jgi:hypothetical protein